MSAFPDTFFEALGGEDGGDSAMRVLREAAFESGLDQEPSPRAQPFFSEGEWESSKTLVSLTLVDADSCFGLLSSLSTPRGTSYTRFCGRRGCEVRSHLTSKLRSEMQRPGWYLASGSSRQGNILEVSFPTLEDGGPISGPAALRLLDPDRPFRMSFGQWLFVHAEWMSQRVISLPSQDSSRSPLPLEVQTSFLEVGSPLSLDVGKMGSLSVQSPPIASAPPAAAIKQEPPEPPSGAPTATPLDLTMSETERRQAQRIAALEAQVLAMVNDLQATRRVAQQACTECDRQESLNAGFVGRLATAERLLATVSSQQEEIKQHRAFVASVEHSLFNPQGDLGVLKAQIKALQTRFDSEGSIECHGVHFSSKTEMAAWFEKNGLTIGIFCDAVGLLHTIQSPVINQAEATKTMESQRKVSMTTDLEAAVITSFSTVLPSILVGNKKEGSGGPFDWLKSYLKDYSIWDPAGRKSGVSTRIREGIKLAARRAEGLLSLTTDDPEAVKVAAGLLSDSATFITSLCTWVESAHRELTVDTPYTSEEVWDMQLECLERIFEELHQARVAVVDAARISQGIYLWGMLKAWQIQQRYVENDFQDDPALTGIFVRRVLLHGQDVSLDERLSKLSDGIKKADEHDRQLQSETKQLQRDVKEIKATIKEIKGKPPGG